MKSKICVMWLVAAAIVSVFAGCSNTTGCTDNRSSLLLAGFYSSSTLRAITVDSILLGGVGAPRDSLLVDTVDRKSQVYLPLRSSNTTTSFFIKYVSKALDYDELNDTITFGYTSEPYFASEECGAVYRYYVKSLRYTTHLIDSVALPDSLINNADFERMKIFFRTSNPNDPEL